LRNLRSRVDANGDGNTGAVTESFDYDAKQRLTNYTVNAPAIPNLSRAVSMDYNAIGNILYKSDVGVYQYGTSGAAHPHAVIGITEGPNPDNSLGYDLNGNLTSATSGKYTKLAYTSFNLPDSQNGIAGQGGYPKYVWNYDENHARIKEVRSLANGDVRTLWYLNPDNAGGLSFESETNNPATPSASDPAITSNRHYLTVDGAVVGVLVSTGNLPSVGASDMAPPSLGSVTLNKVEYWHLDYQNSLTATTDQAGTITERYAYDPFGKRRYTNGSYDAAGNLILDWSATTSGGSGRGYTGHEQLDDIGLTHMNGRIYDATIGRMLQADPIVADLENLQHTNRYAYVWNNPFQWTDPTGYAGNLIGDSICHGGGDNCGTLVSNGFEAFALNERAAQAQQKAVTPTSTSQNTQVASGTGATNGAGGTGTSAVQQVTATVKDWLSDSYYAFKGDLNPQGFGRALESLGPGLAGSDEAAGVAINKLAPVVVSGARSVVRAIDAADMGIARWLRPLFVAEERGNLAKVWNLSPTARGTAIESQLAQTEYKGWFNVGQLNNGKFPLVDFQNGNTLVSLKSVDTTGSTWLGRMQEHIADLGSSRATVNGNPAKMVLDVRVQSGGAAVAQQLVQYGARNNVTVIIKEFK
jgi:RHS repeat-associated protein